MPSGRLILQTAIIALIAVAVANRLPFVKALMSPTNGA